MRAVRQQHGIIPKLARIDTLAAEFPAETNYLYPTYLAGGYENPPSPRKKILVLGSGAYRIGSSVEFDWCCVSGVRAAAEIGYETIMLNYNPETVSTDWDECDRLVFGEVSFESVLDLWENECPEAIVVSLGGQVPNSPALRLARAGVRILGTSAESIDMAEDRRKFSGLLDQLGIDQPARTHVTQRAGAAEAAARLGGFPVLVRPSYVFSGAAMSVTHDPAQFDRILERARAVNAEHPVVVTKFETGAREIEIDAVADDGEIALWAICEHVEDAGVHSGDFDPDASTPDRAAADHPSRQEDCRTAGRGAGDHGALQHSAAGPARSGKGHRVQSAGLALAAIRLQDDCINFVREAIGRMLGVRKPIEGRVLDLDYVAVKAPQFSFPRLVGADPVLGVENGQYRGGGLLR